MQNNRHQDKLKSKIIFKNKLFNKFLIFEKKNL